LPNADHTLFNVFGHNVPSYIKCLTLLVGLQDLINFCKETGLGSSAAAARTATIKLFGVLHRFVGPGLDPSNF
jgi:hypothetical protein